MFDLCSHSSGARTRKCSKNSSLHKDPHHPATLFLLLPSFPTQKCNSAEHKCSPSAPTAKQQGQETAAKPLLCTRIYTILLFFCFFFLLLMPISATQHYISVRPLLPQLSSQDSKLLLNLFFAQGSTPSCHSIACSSFFSYIKVQLSRT